MYEKIPVFGVFSLLDICISYAFLPFCKVDNFCCWKYGDMKNIGNFPTFPTDSTFLEGTGGSRNVGNVGIMEQKNIGRYM